MKILLIRPAPSSETIGLQHVMIVEPLELEVLASTIEPIDKAIIVDMILEKKPFEFFVTKEKPDMVCFTGYITHVSVIIKYCKKAKEINSKIITVVGGVHCEVCSDDFINEAIDYRVVRNASISFPQLIAYCKGTGEKPLGVLSKTETAAQAKMPPFDFYFPKIDRFLTKKYRSRYFYIFHNRVALIKTAFGCPQQCTFCFCRIITNNLFKTRPLDDVIEELQSIQEHEIYIVDDDFFADKKRLIQFLDQIETKKIKKSYLVYGRADFIANNSDLIRRFKKNGLRTVIVGLESFFDDELDEYKKKSSSSLNRRAMSVLNDNRVDCFATVIVPPSWDKSKFKRAGDILLELGIHYVNLQPLTPLPSTDLHLGNREVILARVEFEKWDLAHVSIKPDHLTVAEFYREILNLYNRILFRPKVIFNYLIRYTPIQLYKMIYGAFKVTMQYENKIKEAKLKDRLNHA